MSDTGLGTAEAVLRSVLESTEDDDARFELRTVLELLVVADDEHEQPAESLSEADFDDGLGERLRGLGYIDRAGIRARERILGRVDAGPLPVG